MHFYDTIQDSCSFGFTQRMCNLCPLKSLHGDVFSSLIYSGQNLKAKCPLAGESINKLWYNQIMDEYSTLKGDSLLSHEKTWRNLKCLRLNERISSEKAACRKTPIIGHSRKDETGKHLVPEAMGTRGWTVEHTGCTGQWKYPIWHCSDAICHYTFIWTQTMHNTKSEP